MAKISCFLIFTIFIFSNILHAQKNYKVEGIIINDSLEKISNVNIIVKNIKTSSILNYTNTNNQGYYFINIKSENSIVNITFSSLGYKTITKDFDLLNQSKELEKITLEKNTFELNEIILESKRNAITIKGDTTSYDVDYFKNGTEDNLKDLLNNLPGISINDNGKIVVNGKEINELLIDGENLYNKQHQFATENLSSETIKSIEVYKNHTSFDKLKTNTDSGETALNVLIKNESKNKYKGTIQADYNFNQRYKINSTLYNFNKKNKFSLIQNSNNLGKNPIGINDYFTLVEGDIENTNNKTSNVIYSNINDVPKFLSVGENVFKTNNDFLTISNVFSPTKKIKINFYSINNISTITENLKTNQTFTNSGFDFKENTNNDEKNIFGLFNIKSVYKKNENTLFKLSNSFLTDNVDNNEEIENFSQLNLVNINQENTSKKNILKNNFNFSKKIKRNFLTSNIFFDFTELNFKNNIISNQPFLDLTNSNEFQQSYKKINKKIGYDATYSFEIKNINIKLKTAYNNNFFYFNNKSTSNLDYKNFIKTNSENNINEIVFNYNFTKKLNTSISFDHNLTNQKINDLEKYKSSFFGYSTSLKYSFKTNIFLQISKSLTNNLTEPENLIENYFIKNYRIIIQNFDLKPNSIFPTNKLNLNFFKFNEETNSVLILNINHIYNNKSVGYNYSNNATFNSMEYSIIPEEKLTTAMFFFEKKIKNKPFNLNVNIDYNNTKKAFFINNIPSDYESNYVSNSINFKSTFKESPVHFNLGYNYAINFFENNNNNKTKQVTFQSYLSINGIIFKNFNWKLNTINTIFTTNDSNRKILSLSPTLRYSKSDKWEYYIIGNNILNLKSPEIINNNSNVGYNMQTITATLAGFINFGIKYEF